jgi:hypothetical protein
MGRATVALLIALSCLPAGACGEPDPDFEARASLNEALVTTIFEVLAEPDELDLLTLAHRPFKDTPPERMFHGYPVLGRASITDRAQQRSLVGAFYQSAREGGGYMLCFMPHHALHAVRGDAVVDIVICFGCLQYVVYDGQRRPMTQLSPLAGPLFQRVAREHHLPAERHWYDRGRSQLEFRRELGLPDRPRRDL